MELIMEQNTSLEDRFLLITAGKHIFMFSAFILSITFSTLFAQSVKNIDSIKSNVSKVKEPDSTQAVNDEINFKNESGNSILTITDEGTAGSITLPSLSTIGNTTDKLYNMSGTLYFNGSALGSGGGASSLDDLSDAIYKANSLFLGTGSGSRDINTGLDNTAIGYNSMHSNTTGRYNTANGCQALYSNTVGSFNTANGYYALYHNSGVEAVSEAGNDNTANGAFALYNNTIGYSNTANGYYALYSNKAGSNGVAIGEFSQENVNNSTDIFNNANTSVGYGSLKGGTDPSNNTGNYNSAFGYQALSSNTTGSYNTANGDSALSSNTTGNNNTAIGSNTMHSNTTGYNNTANGYFALSSNISGSHNTANGFQALYSNTTGRGNVALGYEAGYQETGSNKLYIENSASSTPLIWGDFANDQVVINGNASDNSNNRTFFSNGPAGGTTAWYNDSDRRLKKNISTIENALEKVNKLRGVNYKWKDSKTHSDGLQMGFIAQEAEKVIPEVVDNSDDHYSMQYAPITALLVEAVKDQNKEFRSQNKELKKRVEQLEKENENLKTVVNENKILSNRINMIEAVLNKLVQQKPTIKVTKK